ncbi:toxin ParE1/3/4 [Geoalkalibacter ferrihydriticus]|uniref:Toxin n=2 Tax=Geoalkalibacter ferrihydriticus TaxID=392333 RepID=A0A0C2HRM0_9BACT|nr:plasmid stabilization protein [Geoalkalibacter ferrihydriticus DSM 17813]SDM92716.1 toxin ParE1/3/4 [Geoalkalibacter ferrihydriticus]
MSHHHLVISPAARDDLRDIYLFSLRNWGQNQSSKYIENLKECLWSLTERPHIGMERPELLPEIRSFPIESHIVFYQVQSKHITIVRVLHSRQDPNRLV